MNAIAHPRWVGRQVPVDMPVRFHDRGDAGSRLAERLMSYGGPGTLVLGIPRGGMPVALVIARVLRAKLDIIVVRKLTSPICAELAIGAATADGGRFLNEPIVRELGVDPAYIESETTDAIAEAKRRESRWRGTAPPLDVAGRTVILADDGLATGATMVAAARSVRARKPARLIIAVPVGSVEACALLQSEADEVICLHTPEPFWAIGLHYSDYRPIEDADVDRLLRQADGDVDRIMEESRARTSAPATDGQNASGAAIQGIPD